MRELAQVRSAVEAALRRAGLETEAVFPDRPLRRYKGAVASVAVGAAEGKALGICAYLGQVQEAGGGIQERYGKRLEGSVTVDIRAERAAECEAGCETAAAVLLGDLPEGIRPGELRWEALCWERETELFLRRGTLACRAVFTAQAEEDSGEFLDFILKGVLKGEGDHT